MVTVGVLRQSRRRPYLTTGWFWFLGTLVPVLGLVRMGRPENLERVLLKALSDARWCSNDPICMESARSGQGPDSLNLAACHSCGLLPETSCERFNRLLDRGVVVGSFENPLLGFFSGVESVGL